MGIKCERESFKTNSKLNFIIYIQMTNIIIECGNGQQAPSWLIANVETPTENEIMYRTSYFELNHQAWKEH